MPDHNLDMIRLSQPQMQHSRSSCSDGCLFPTCSLAKGQDIRRAARACSSATSTPVAGITGAPGLRGFWAVSIPGSLGFPPPFTLAESGHHSPWPKTGGRSPLFIAVCHALCAFNLGKSCQINVAIAEFL